MISRNYLLVTGMIAVAVAFSPSASSATTYYVTTSGNDTHGCTNNTTDACRTITRGLALATAAGSVIQVGAGTYSESPTLSHSGSPGNPIVLQGYAVGENCPTSATTDPYGASFGFSTRPNPTVAISGTLTISASYVRVQCFSLTNGNLRVTPSPYSNIDIWDNYIHDTVNGVGISVAEYPSSFSNMPSNVTVKRNYIYRYAHGIWIWCQNNCLVQDNEVDTNWLSSANPDGDSDYMWFFGAHITFEHNYSHDYSANNCPNGVSQCHDDGWQTYTIGNPPPDWQVSHDITWNGNVVFNIMDGIIGDDYTSSTYGTYKWEYNWTITNNIFGLDPGGSYNANCVVTGHAGNVILRFNTCITGQLNSHDGSQTSYLQGNILANASHGNFSGCHPMTQESGSQVLTEDHNLFYCPSGTVSGFPNDVTNLQPGFVNSSGRDYHLQSDSPAISQGPTGTGVSTDFEGNTRGSPPDIGSYEYGGGTSLKPEPPTGLQVTVF